jgi:thioredoxin-like negative regulator of GroEL
MREASRVLCLIAVVGCTTHGNTPPKAQEEPPPVDRVEIEPVVAVTPVLVQAGAPELRWTEAKCDLPPVSLTASDGSGLALTQLAAEAVIHGPLAFTELRLAFHNPEDRDIEGRFSVTLPEDAAISRLAMKIDGRWQEGEVVELQAARVAYEDFLHRKQDPALMEREAGNVYSARVFPIPARGDKQLIVSYSQELAGAGEPYRLPLCGLPKVAALDVNVRVEQPSIDSEQSRWSGQLLEVHERDHAPRGDIEVANVGASAAYGVRSGSLAIASLIPPLDDVVAPPIGRATILFDTSASRANDFSGQVIRLGQLVRALGSAHPGLAVEVIAFDQTTEKVFAGAAVDFGEVAEGKLLARGPLGASAFDVALAAVAADANAPERLILVSDGMLTTGDDLGALGPRLQALEDAGLRRLDVIVDGNAADLGALTTLARGELPEHGLVVRGATPLPELVARLGAGTRSGIAVEVEGASWVWPERLDGVQPGDAVLVYAQLDANMGPTLRVTLDGTSTLVPTLPAPAPLVERAQARATIAALEAKLLGSLAPEEAEAIRADIVETSVQSRVLSELTALLVLETESDYRRFGIERNALADILVVGEQGVEILQRRGDDLVIARADVRPREDRTADKKKMSMSADGGLLDDGDFEGGVPGGVEGGVEGGVVGGVLGGVAMAEGYGSGHGSAASAPASEPMREEARPRPDSARDEAPSERSSGEAQPIAEPPPRANAHTGRYAEIMRLLARKQLAQAVDEARAWVAEAPGDVLAMTALGDAYKAAGDLSAAARAYGSLIDFYPARTDIRRMAGARLEALDDVGLLLAEDTYRRAVEQRPDHPSGYRLLAWVLVKRGELAEAFDVLDRSLDREYPEDRYLGVKTVLRQDLGIVAAMWIAREPAREAEIRERTVKRHTRVNNRHSLRFVLNWETDANDVDLHVWDDEGGHAFYGNKSLASGGELVADVTTGYGPEAFVIDGRRSGFPYRLMAHYYSRGAMGYGMGKLQVLEHDGAGHVVFTEHPFVVMKDDAWVDLTVVRRRLLTHSQ